ncbi:hypothetical protein [Teichococcus vastitatis]|uniref:hypothetical protein n=1 Tax=Teichococcus vastitatis TaxID=2307076 RepID=UPI001EE4C6A9|nr:hypothetical protein [Pseudoroseomonas vastitatis]
MLARLSSFIDPGFVLLLLAEIAALALGFWLTRRWLHRSWRSAAYAVLAVLAVRVALFGNPLAWGAYYVVLQGHADWRQTDVIAERFRSMLPLPRGVEFLAVGSSQTHALYRGFSRDHAELQIFSLAGMTPMDMELYRDHIIALKPKQVLLYISEFDLAADLRPEWARLAPVSLLQVADRVEMLDAALPPNSLPDLKRDLLLGALLPEYRYNFVFRAILSRAAQMAHLPGFRPERSSDDEVNYTALRARGQHSMQSQSRLLESFIRNLDNADIGVVLVEGQYNPKGETPDLQRQNAAFKQYLVALQRQYPKLIVLQREDLPQLTSADFDDAYHLSTESGHRLAGIVLRTARERLGQGTAITSLGTRP